MEKNRWKIKKMKEKKIKVNKLFLYVFWNHFIYFLLNNFKMYKILINFYYIYIYIYIYIYLYFHNETNQ